ncbi:MAG: hypothetical protein WA081_00370 [Desulfosalsimonadaceae bacterium]
MKRYEIAARYCFDGIFFVSADSLTDAKQKVSESCGLVLGGGIHTTLQVEEIDWKFPVHPEMSILHARIFNQTEVIGENTYGKLS